MPLPAPNARLCLAGLIAMMVTGSQGIAAQGVTTTGIRGAVEMADGSDPDGGRVVVRNEATGFEVETEIRRGRFVVAGLEPGGPYTIVVRRIGALARQWRRVFLTLGEPLELHVSLEVLAVELDSMVVAGGTSPVPLRHGGTAYTLGDSLVHRLPSLNRDVYDFLRLVPQVSTRIGFPSGGISGGGVSFRLNHFLTNGVSERSLAGGQPPEFAGGKSLPFEAVREYQVLLAPFDVRYGDFAGAMVNTVTRSGTNRFGGSLFLQGRSDHLARGGDQFASPYDRWQYGASLSGPIVRDRAQFFVSTELRDLSSPMAGPYVGQGASVSPPVPVTSADLNRLSTALAQYGLSAGSGRALATENDIRNLFVRLDGTLPSWYTRAVLWFNGSNNRSLAFSRTSAPDTFALTSNATTTRFDTRTAALQLFTAPPGWAGAQNQFSLSRRSIPFELVPEVRQPLIQVLAPSISGGVSTLMTGPPAQAQAGVSRTWNVNLRDDLTMPFGASHEATFGLEVEWFRVGAPGLRNAFGTWTFASLDSLENGQADRYELNQDFGSASAALSGRQYGISLGDFWRVSERLSLTFGLRGDLLAINQRAPYNPTVDSLFGRRTDVTFARTLHFSPRLGFTWEVGALTQSRVRGGLGLFTGRPPLAWLHIPLQNYGEGIGTLRCGTLPGDLGLPPIFNPDPDQPPVTCAGGAGLSGPPRGDVDLIAPNLRMARTLRATLAFERRLPIGLTGTVEALVTRNLRDYAFVNLNLAGPVGTDRRGRVLYGSIDSLGRARPARINDSLPSVVELQNVSGNHAIQVSASLAREFAGGLSLLASYTWSRVRDVQTPLRVNSRGLLNWASRAVSGYHSDLSPGISLNDVPHRVTLAGTWRAPWRRWTTELSMLYVGESGNPFTWLTGGVRGRGDLNADGALNDPVYVPTSAFNPDEILFDGSSSTAGANNSPGAVAARIAAQMADFERFIQRTPCLRRHRGRIIARNSCREPWSHTTVATVRQAIPLGGGGLETQLDLFNLLNLLDRDWGLRRVVASPALLEHVGQVVGPSGQLEPTFHFTGGSARYRIDSAESAFQFQFSVRYRF